MPARPRISIDLSEQDRQERRHGAQKADQAGCTEGRAHLADRLAFVPAFAGNMASGVPGASVKTTQELMRQATAKMTMDT